MRMMRRRFVPVFPILTAIILLAGVGHADVFSKDDFQLTGDFRGRLEADFDSERADGSERDDRTRIRIRTRLGLEFNPTDRLSFGVRLRSGSNDSHQSPHVTILDLDGNHNGDAHLNFDKWYVKMKSEKAWAWVGRNSLPLWKPNEHFWDDDVMPAGVAFGFRTAAGEKADFAVNAGYFSAPVGMRDFSGDLGAGQVVFQKSGWTVAASVLSFDADPADPDAVRLLRGNGLRDYTILAGSLQSQFTRAGRRITLGLDVMHNSENYSPTDPDPFTAANYDQTDGFILTTKLDAGDWLAAWYYSEVETFAVNSSFSQDDWMRWGTLTQNRNSDYAGHELRFTYKFEKNQNLVVRFYRVDALTSGEDGSRFRVDYNYKF